MNNSTSNDGHDVSRFGFRALAETLTATAAGAEASATENELRVDFGPDAIDPRDVARFRADATRLVWITMLAMADRNVDRWARNRDVEIVNVEADGGMLVVTIGV